MLLDVIIITSLLLHRLGTIFTNWMQYYIESRVGAILHRVDAILHRLGAILHRLNVMLHRFCAILHRLDVILHRLGAILHRLGVILHRLDAILHRQTVDAAGLLLLLMACHKSLVPVQPTANPSATYC